VLPAELLLAQHMEANKPDEATNAAVGSRLLVVDEAGSNKTSEGAKGMVLDAATVKKFCDVAGTPIPYQPKYQAQDTTLVSWALLFYGNVVPEMRNADAAFKRRPSLMEIATEFVAQKDYDPENKLHVLADERFRNRKFLAGMVPELMHWMRRLVPALYVTSASSLSKLQPVPASVRSFTEEAAGTEEDKAAAKDLKALVGEWLATCTTAVEKPGRGARPSVPIQKAKQMDAHFQAWAQSQRNPWEVIRTIDAAFEKASYGTVYCYQKGTMLLTLRPEAPTSRGGSASSSAA
jgi:phage/plasmid-associated DNA primase